MATAITIYNRQEMTTEQNFNSGLFNEFISWIDRSDKTARSYLTNLRQFMAWLKYEAISNPIRQDIISYRNWLSAEHDAISLDETSAAGWAYRLDAAGNPLRINCRPNTITQYLRSVCQFFKWTAANNLYPDIAANIRAPRIKHDMHHKDALTAQEVLAIETRTTEQGKRLYAIYLLAVNAGLRTIEISRANVKDLETKGGQAWLYIWGKGHAEPDQKKPLAPEVAAAIKEYLQSRTDRPTGTSPLFVSTGNRSGGQRIATTTISTMLKRAMQAAGFDSERITAHSLRHTAGTAVQEITGDIYATQKYMRHSNPATTEIYLHNDAEKAEAGIAQQLYNLYHGTGSTDPREKLAGLLDRMSPAQLEQLTGIASAMM